MHNRVLIVGTLPYNTNTSSRSFDAYFHNWEKENLRQFFSNSKTPVKGHCSSLFQITDHRMLQRFFKKDVQVGKIFNYDDLPQQWVSHDLEVNSSFFSRLYKLGSRHTPLTHLARKYLWREKYWNTEKFNDWLDEFQPECVFLAFSNDFFILEIALYVAEKYNIPIVSCIGDDYYFNDRFSISPIYHLYRRQYKALARKVFRHRGSAIYISDKIRDKYNHEFGLTGETVYLTSNIPRRDFRPIHVENLRVSYCGNINMGRNYSLAEIGAVLQQINPNYYLDVYSAEVRDDYINVLRGKPGINYMGGVSYSEVVDVMHKSDIVVVAEGFDEKSINITRYSLSTKAADALSTGAQILVYGAMDCGVIEYMHSTGAAVVCTEKEALKDSICKLLTDISLQKQLYEQSVRICEQNHSKQHNLSLSEKIISDTVDGNGRYQNASILISSCDNFSDLWEHHFYFLKKNWHGKPWKIYMVTDKPTSRRFDGVEIIVAPEGLDFPKRIQYAAEQIDTEYILLTLDDYFVIHPVSSADLEHLVYRAKAESIDYLQLYSRRDTDPKKYEAIDKLYPIDLNTRYAVTLYPAIWERIFLKNSVIKDQSPWEYEPTLTNYAQQAHANCQASHYGAFDILDVIRKGKLLHNARKHLKMHGITLENRQTISRLTEAKLHIMDFINWHFPRRLRVFIKNTAIRCGMKFYSED